MLPLTVKSIRSSKAMQELQPKIKELQKKHGNDRQRISQETMALYQQYRVNPMAGCLPMVIQIPIFFGLYRAIMLLSTSGAGLWDQGFLWLPSLAHPDPCHILPILAGLFQFVQTQMMRPANQPKSTDPQQAMMNSVMNIMPLTVVFFGWNFASGPVIYWATQSVYSVVQQWFITGWGNLHKWAPFLPELPEHRRLGYRPPRDLDAVVVVSGEGQPVSRPGRWAGCNARWTRRKAGVAATGCTAERRHGPPARTEGDAIEVDATPVARATAKWLLAAAGPGTASGKEAARALRATASHAAPEPRAGTMAPR